MFSLHHTLPPALNSLSGFSLNPTAQVSAFPLAAWFNFKPQLPPHQASTIFLFLSCTVNTARPIKRTGRIRSKESRIWRNQWASWWSRCKWWPCPCQNASLWGHPLSPSRQGGSLLHGGTDVSRLGWAVSGNLLWKPNESSHLPSVFV